MGTEDRECISQGKRQAVPAEGRVTTGRDDHFQRESFIGGTGRSFLVVTAGRDGHSPVSRLDRTVIVRCHGGTGR